MPSAVETNGAARTEDVRAATPMPAVRGPRLVAPVAITLDKERHMVMDFEAMERFEQATGMSAWGREAWDGRPRTMAYLLWSALLHEDPDLELDTIKPYIIMSNLGYISERLAELWGEMMPDADEAETEAGTEGDADPNPRRRRPG